MMNHTKKNAARITALLLALVMLLAAFPAQTAKAYTTEELFERWESLDSKWLSALSSFKSDNADLKDVLGDVVALEQFMSLYNTMEIALVELSVEYAKNKKDGTYNLSNDDLDAKITKKNGVYLLRLSDASGDWRVQFNSKNMSMRCSISLVEGGSSYTLYTDLIPTSKGMYSSVVAVTDGEAAAMTKYMRDSFVYIAYTQLDKNENPEDYRLSKAPKNYTELKGKNSAVITLTSKGKLSFEYDGDTFSTQSK